MRYFLAVAAVLVLPSLSSAGGEAPQSAEDQLNEAIEYVNSMDETCVLTDGYQCQPDAPDPSTSSRTYSDAIDGGGAIPAAMISVWPTALTHFQSLESLTAEQKKLKHYRVGFSLRERQATVLFRPLFLPTLKDGKPVAIQRASIGREVRITVDITSQKVTKVIFGR